MNILQTFYSFLHLKVFIRYILFAFAVNGTRAIVMKRKERLRSATTWNLQSYIPSPNYSVESFLFNTAR